MAIQTVVPGRQPSQKLAEERAKGLRDIAEERFLEAEELKAKLATARSEEEQTKLQRELTATEKRGDQLTQEVAAILKTPVEQLQEGRVIGLSDEAVEQGIADLVQERKNKRIVGAGTPIELTQNDSIANPRTGEPLDYSSIESQYLQAEKEAYEAASVDLSPEAFPRLAENFRESMDDTTLANFGRLANSINKSLNATKTRLPYDPDGFTPAINMIRDLVNAPSDMSNAEIENTIALSLLAVGEGAYAKQQSLEPDAPQNILDDVAELDLDVLAGGGIQTESFNNMLKAQLRNRLITQPMIDEQGRALQRTPIDEDSLQQVSEIITASLLSSGQVKEGKVQLIPEKIGGEATIVEGYNPLVPVYYLNDDTYSIVRKASQFIRVQDPSRIPKKASNVPGGKRGALINQGKVLGAQKDAAAEKYEADLNNVAHYVDNQSLGFATAMYAATQGLINDFDNQFEIMESTLPGFAKLADLVMNTKLFKDTTNMSEAQLFALDKARRQEELMSRLALSDITEIYIEGLQVFAQHTTDLMNMRVRNTEMNINPQRSKIHRGVVISGRPKKVNTSFRDRRIDASAPLVPGPVVAKIIGRREAEDYSPLNGAELEAAHLYTIAYNLLEDIAGVDPKGLPEDKILSYVTPEFLKQVATVGRAFNLMFPKSLTKEDFQDVTALQDKIINSISKLFPDEQAIVTRAIQKMSKGDWGYKFRSYIAAADYLDTPGNSITSDLTLEYDYNSAGLSFMQSHAGRQQFLSLVGIISEYQQKTYDDAMAFGSPRNLFLDDITKHLLGSSMDNHSGKRIGEAIKNAMLFANSKKELIGLAKSILLTIGYAKPAMFQHDNIRDAMEEIPELKALEDEGIDVVNILNYSVSQTVRNVIETKYTTKLKQGAHLMTMVGLPVYMETESGLQVPMFKTINEEIEGVTPIEVQTIDDEGNPKVTLVAKKERVPLLREQAKPKKVAPLTYYVANSGAAVANRIGAIIGQYLETLSLRGASNAINKEGNSNRQNIPVYMETVFDNVITDIEGAFYWRTAMNGAAAKRALAFNSTAATLRTYAKALSAENLRKILPETIEINKNTNYGLLLENIQQLSDRYYNKKELEDLAQIELDELTRPKVKKFLAYLDNHPNPRIKRLGEITIDSDESVILTKQEFGEVMGQLMYALGLTALAFESAANKSVEAQRDALKNFATTMYFAG